MDLPFDRAITPWFSNSCDDSGIVSAEALCKSLDGRTWACLRIATPALQRRRIPITNHGQKRLSQVDRRSKLHIRRTEGGQELVLRGSS